MTIDTVNACKQPIKDVSPIKTGAFPLLSCCFFRGGGVSSKNDI